MSNLIDYLAWRGDLTFEHAPFNDLDGVLLSLLSYVNFDDILTEDGPALPLADAAGRFFELHPEEELSSDRSLIRWAPSLFRALAGTARFGAMPLSHYVNLIDPESELQFAALTCKPLPGISFISFRGTDDTIVGWKEDFNMSYKTVPAEREAVRYTERFCPENENTLLFGGHSKGGHIAVYAAARADAEIRERIAAVYDCDGPGFNRTMLFSGVSIAAGGTQGDDTALPAAPSLSADTDLPAVNFAGGALTAGGSDGSALSAIGAGGSALPAIGAGGSALPAIGAGGSALSAIGSAGTVQLPNGYIDPQTADLSAGLREISPRIRRFIPQSSIIGMLLEHTACPVIVKSIEHGPMQHDPTSWQVLGTSFVTEDGLSRAGELFDASFRSWINQTDPEARKAFIEDMFSVLEAAGTEKLSDLSRPDLRSSVAVLARMNEINPETREKLRSLAEILFEEMKDQLPLPERKLSLPERKLSLPEHKLPRLRIRRRGKDA